MAGKNLRSLALVALILSIASCRPGNHNDVETVEVRRGEFSIEVAEQGEINATRAVAIATPAIGWQFGMLKITEIVENGSEVEAGDTVIRFDPSDVHKVIIDARARLEIANAEMAKLVAQQESKIGELEADLRVSELDYQINQIKLEQATFDSEVARKELQLSLEKAKISLETAGEEIDNQKKIHAEEVRQKEVNIRQIKKELKEANETLGKLTVTSPAPGIAILWQNWSTREKWAVGDQPWPGEPLINLPDLSELKAETEINEIDIAKIKLDQKVEIRLDAFSDTVFTGRVISIAGLAKFKNRNSKIKIFPVEVLLDETSSNLMPGMTVSCRIMVDRIEDAVYIPLEALFREGAEEYVFVRTGKRFKKKTIETGLANNDYVIVQKGLREGDRISLTDLSTGVSD